MQNRQKCLRSAGELLGNAVPGALDASSNTGLRVGGRVGGGRVLALWSRVHLVDCVAGATTADVVDGGSVLAEALLLGELLVEGEHGSLLLAVDVAGSATAGHEVRVGGRWGELDARGRARGVLAVGHLTWVDAGDVACSAAAIAGIGGGGDGWVRLGDVVGRHFGFVSSDNFLRCCCGEVGGQSRIVVVRLSGECTRQPQAAEKIWGSV